jgi:hypothetical protein
LLCGAGTETSSGWRRWRAGGGSQPALTGSMGHESLPLAVQREVKTRSTAKSPQEPDRSRSRSSTLSIASPGQQLRRGAARLHMGALGTAWGQATAKFRLPKASTSTSVPASVNIEVRTAPSHRVTESPAERGSGVDGRPHAATERAITACACTQEEQLLRTEPAATQAHSHTQRD